MILVFQWASEKGKKKAKQEQEQAVKDIELGGDTFELVGEVFGEITEIL